MREGEREEDPNPTRSHGTIVTIGCQCVCVSNSVSGMRKEVAVHGSVLPRYILDKIYNVHR
jgi:hypothetical protein